MQKTKKLFVLTISLLLASCFSTSKVSNPVITPDSGEIGTDSQITITCATPLSKIYYTTDGTNPDIHSNEYKGPITIISNTTIKARAFLEGTKPPHDPSDIVTASYTVSTAKVADPFFSPEEGTYEATQSVTIETTTVGASIRYTDNGNDPNCDSSTLYTTPISISTSKNLKAIGCKEGISPSNIRTAMYSIVLGYYIGGNFDSIGTATTHYLAQLESNGKIDKLFTLETGEAFDSTIYSTLVQADNKIIIAGAFTNYKGTASNQIVRLNNDLSFDSSFTSNIGTGFDGGFLRTIITQENDNKILAGGNFITYDGITANNIVRLNSIGTLDTTFNTNTGSGFDNEVYIIKVQDNGKILVGGVFTEFNGSSSGKIARLNDDGTIDLLFTLNIGTGFNGDVYSLSIQDDGKILVGGSFTSFDATDTYYIARLNEDGTLDTTFTNNSGGGFDSSVTSVLLQPDGKILTGGWFTTYDGTDANKIARLNSNGTLDTNFTANAVNLLTDGSVITIALQEDTKILIGGDFTNSITPINEIARLNSDGTVDSTFESNTSAGFDDAVFSITVIGNDSILLGGYMGKFNGGSSNRIAKLDLTGVNVSFFGAGFNDEVTVIKKQSDGKLLIGGYFTQYNGAQANAITRIKTDGSIDTDFATNSGTGFDNYIEAIAIQSDGKILVGGNFTSYNGTSANNIVRLNSDGTLDTVFMTTVGDGASSSISSIILQNDGKILLGGWFNTFNGQAANRLVRLNSTGTIDTEFTNNQSGGFNHAVYAIALQTDGKILVGGRFSAFAGLGTSCIARLNSTGTIDSVFYNNQGTAFGGSIGYYVKTITIQADSKILVGGNFSAYNGTSSPKIARLSADGVIDASFTHNIGTGFNDAVSSLLLQSNGKILAVGSFTSYNTVSSPYMTMLNSDGSLDTSFNLTRDAPSYDVTIIENQ